MLLCLILTISSVVAFAEPPILDYRDIRVPNVSKPIAGMKVRIEHQDGSGSEQWIKDDGSFDALEAYVGDKVIITDWSQSRDNLKRWDFQYYDGIEEHSSYKSATQGAVISTFTLENVGTYELYMSVQDVQTVGMYQNWSDNGSHRAEKMLDNGQLYYMYFIRQDIKVLPTKPPVEDKYLIPNISAPSTAEKGETVTLSGVNTMSSSPIIAWEWKEETSVISSSMEVDRKMTKTKTFTLTVTNAQGMTASTTHTITVLDGERVDYIHCSFDIEKDITFSTGTFGGYKTKYDDNSYVEGKESEKYKGIDKYIVSLYDTSDDSKDTSFEVSAEQLNDDGTSATSYIKRKIEDILEGWYTAEGDYTVGVSQYAYDEAGDYDTDFEFIKLHMKTTASKPKTSIDVSDPFYPSEIDKDENKTVEWSYSSSEGIPYKESIVSLYRLNGATETPVFENQIMTERSLIINEDAGTELRIKVKVKNTNGALSDEKQTTWTVAGGKPNIDLTLTPQDNSIKTKVDNLNPAEIEAVFPTTYTRWDIKNSEGVVIQSDSGKIKTTISLDSYDIDTYRATQYAENNLGNEAFDTEEFKVFSSIDFNLDPRNPFEGELVEVTDLSKGVTNQQWFINKLGEPREKLVFSNGMKFTRVPGTYEITLEGDGFFDGKAHASVTKEITFLDATPNAGFIVHDYKKMYKELYIEGKTPSQDATSNYLQNRYPILFDDNRTQFVIEPLDDAKNPDYSLNDYIKGADKVIIDGKVTFRAKSELHIRFDREGWYRASYKVANVLKESAWYSQDFYIAPEYPLDINLIVADPTIYRDPHNELKSTITVFVDYNSPDNDLLDEDKSKLLISFDKNRDGDYTNDGADSNQYYTKNDEVLQDYIDEIKVTYAPNNTPNRVMYEIIVDNPTKNFLGKFKFDYEAIEKPRIPNYTALGVVPIIKSDTLNMVENQKIAFIDNQKPIITLEMTSGPSMEIFIFEESNNPLDAQMIFDGLKANKVNVVRLYHVLRNGTVVIYE